MQAFSTSKLQSLLTYVIHVHTEFYCSLATEFSLKSVCAEVLVLFLKADGIVQAM